MLAQKADGEPPDARKIIRSAHNGYGSGLNNKSIPVMVFHSPYSLIL